MDRLSSSYWGCFTHSYPVARELADRGSGAGGVEPGAAPGQRHLLPRQAVAGQAAGGGGRGDGEPRDGARPGPGHGGAGDQVPPGQGPGHQGHCLLP